MHAVDLLPADLDVLRDERAREDLSPAGGVGLAVLDLREAGGACPLDATLPRTLVCPVIARTSATTASAWRAFADACDVILDDEKTDRAAPDDGLDVLRTNVLASPLAAAALAVLLRTRPAGRTDASATTIDHDLVAESAVYSLLQAGPEFAAWRATTPRRTRPADGAPLSLERDGSRLRITLTRPRVHNAFNAAMRDALVEALQLACSDDTIEAIDVFGAGPSFSSGGDLDEFGSFGDPATSHAVRLARNPARLFARLAPRLQVHLHGACMGAGIELPAFAARITAAPDTRLALPEIRYGLVPGAGGTASVPRRIGRHRAAYLALSGAVLDASTALRWGLVDEIAEIAEPTTD